MIDYSQLIDYMLSYVKDMKHATAKVKNLHHNLRALRRYSDIACLVAYPKNPNKSLAYLKTLRGERERYLTFRNHLAQTTKTFLKLFGELLTKNHHDQISKLLTTEHLALLEKNPPKDAPIPEKGIITLKQPNNEWRKAALLSLCRLRR